MNKCFEVEYIDVMSGKVFNHKTTSEFIADKLVSNIMAFANENKIPIWKTKLKIIKERPFYTHCFITVNKVEKLMLSIKLYHN